ncbi:hypothetical protein K470DRAFT_266686 [Piedraia hortae CBS 480.64]|uniref:SPIN90/Ldb17 leucine-rich domain-containing protein n=1 Tax=Piedraia hortae CBS 480.64 TaxID=1314780 RepID=A0A6A7BT00_9PEZI|nr:hypothetical protein K470DRAFT_266686 [Piedraia hortae CBS 480.64]
MEEEEIKFWSDLDAVVNTPCQGHEEIDNVLRSYLDLSSQFKQGSRSEHDIARCSYILLKSKVFRSNQDYVRRQFLYCLLQEDDVQVLYTVSAMLLSDGRVNESTFELMQSESAFPRLIELVRGGDAHERGFHKLLLELLYETTRCQKLAPEEMNTVDDDLILHLFQLIEDVSDDADDPYHYPIIRVLLVLNEQYMCHVAPNRVIGLLSIHGPKYRTFGENLIILLNREVALSPQLLILKILYLLFTTPATFEYFYTNDLHVLVDVVIRNLLDLDPTSGNERDGQTALTHTYLRVLCPLLKNSQLARQSTHYKAEEVRRLLHLLVNSSSAHFAPVDETVLRLVKRCRQIEWLREDDDEKDRVIEQKLAGVKPSSKDVANKALGMSFGQEGDSSISVTEVAAKVAKEKPSLPAPRRKKKAANGQLKPPPLQTKCNAASDGR